VKVVTMVNRFGKIVLGLVTACILGLAIAARAQTTPSQTQPLETRLVYTWFRLALELTRHTATYMPPVAARQRDPAHCARSRGS
jgi:hypothetical protein